MTKVTIIGAGSVGSTIAYTLAVGGIATEIVMIDINEEKALGEALDIRQGTPFCPPVSIYAGTYRDACDSDIVILTSGVARKPGQSRLDLAQTNVNIIKSIIPQITKYAPDATYVIVSNPVDILTYTWCKCSDLPENKIIGSGTILDTARLRARISEYYNINRQNVHAYDFQRSRRRIPQRYHKQGQHLHTHQPRRNRDIHQKVRRKNHSAQGCYILCNRAFHLPHLQVHNQRNGHNTYGFLHDARRIRH